VFTALTASEAMFDLVRAVAENVEHQHGDHGPGAPSAYDPMVLYADRLGKELRIARSNPSPRGGRGGDHPAGGQGHLPAQRHVRFQYLGAIFDLEAIVAKAEPSSPICSSWWMRSSMPPRRHGPQENPVDAITFAPYKFFGSGARESPGYPSGWRSCRTINLLPSQFGVLTEIVNYVCWIGSKFMNSTDRRTLYVVGMTRIALHKQALMHLMFNGKDGLPGLREMENVEVFLDYKDLEKRTLLLQLDSKYRICQRRTRI